MIAPSSGVSQESGQRMPFPVPGCPKAAQMAGLRIFGMWADAGKACCPAV